MRGAGTVRTQLTLSCAFGIGSCLEALFEKMGFPGTVRYYDVLPRDLVGKVFMAKAGSTTILIRPLPGIRAR